MTNEEITEKIEAFDDRIRAIYLADASPGELSLSYQSMACFLLGEIVKRLPEPKPIPEEWVEDKHPEDDT